MKRQFLIFLLITTVSVVFAQQQDICSHLKTTGRVLIQQDTRLTDLLGTQPKTYYANNQNSPDQQAQATTGYRIRVYSGNQQNVSKDRCYSIQEDINEMMPELTTYVTFKTPNWRISVGDYRSSEEAHAMLYQLRKAFPAYAKEMFVVKEKINL